MRVLLYDTETQSLPLWNQPSEHPDQPHLCQVTAVLLDDTNDVEIEYLDRIVIQEWPVAPEAFAAHGITPERSHAEGFPESVVTREWLALAKMADRIVGYNLPFDIRLMRIAALRAGRSKDTENAFAARIKPLLCDLQPKCTPLCRLPPTEKMMAAGRKTWKTPSLVEAARILLGMELGADAHDSRGDVLATKLLYFYLKQKGEL